MLWPGDYQSFRVFIMFKHNGKQDSTPFFLNTPNPNETPQTQYTRAYTISRFSRKSLTLQERNIVIVYSFNHTHLRQYFKTQPASRLGYTRLSLLTRPPSARPRLHSATLGYLLNPAGSLFAGYSKHCLLFVASFFVIYFFLDRSGCWRLFMTIAKNP